MKSLTWLATALLVFFTVAIAQAQVPGDPLPAPDTGKQWSVTFDDEFNGSAVDTTKWNGQYGGGLQWCNGCAQLYTGVTEANGVVQIASNPTASNPAGANGLNSGGSDAASAKFSQRFGYWSVRAQEPPYGQYDGAPLWLFPIGKSSFPNNPDCVTDGNEEIDFGEAYNLGSIAIAPDPFHVSFSYHDFCFNTPYTFAFPDNVDTSAGFHVYGLLWENDGSAHGSFTPYFDGAPLSSPIPTDSLSNLWDNGVYMLLNEQSETTVSPPLMIDWVHVYQQVAETGAPSISIASPTNEATVGGTITVTATVANAAGTYTKWYLPNAPVNGSCAVGQYDGAWNGCSLYGQLSFSYNTELLPKGPTRFYVQLYKSSGTYTGANATVNLTVAQTPPRRISITSPANGSTASGTDPVAVRIEKRPWIAHGRMDDHVRTARRRRFCSPDRISPDPSLVIGRVTQSAIAGVAHQDHPVLCLSVLRSARFPRERARRGSLAQQRPTMAQRALWRLQLFPLLAEAGRSRRRGA